MYRNDEDRQHDPTAQEIEMLIKQYIEIHEGWINKERESLKQLERNYKEFAKIMTLLRNFLNKTPNKYDYEREIQNMLLK